MTALQYPVNWNKQVPDTIRINVSDEVWIQLLSTPLPEYDRWQHNELKYQRAVSEIEELRTAVRVRAALLITDQSGNKISKRPRINVCVLRFFPLF